MSETRWSPDMPLRAGATDTEIEDRVFALFTSMTISLAYRQAARELVAAETAALRARVTELEAKEGAMSETPVWALKNQPPIFQCPSMTLVSAEWATQNAINAINAARAARNWKRQMENIAYMYPDTTTADIAHMEEERRAARNRIAREFQLPTL